MKNLHKGLDCGLVMESLRAFLQSSMSFRDFHIYFLI
jgi:hypothetical protein